MHIPSQAQNDKGMRLRSMQTLESTSKQDSLRPAANTGHSRSASSESANSSRSNNSRPSSANRNTAPTGSPSSAISDEAHASRQEQPKSVNIPPRESSSMLPNARLTRPPFQSR